MSDIAKVFAHLMDWDVPRTPALDGTIRVCVEWNFLFSPRTNAKFIFHSDPMVTRDKLARDIIDALVVYLNTQFPGSNYRERDIVLW